MGILDKASDIAGVAVAAGMVSLLAACTFTPWQSLSREGDDDAAAAAHAVGEKSETGTAVASPVAMPLVTTSATPTSATSAAAAPAGFYRVKAGDTLYHIAATQKQRAADISAWNKLPASGQVQTGQLLRVTPPAAAPAVAEAKSAASTSTPASTAATTTPRASSRFIWPTNGTVTPTTIGKSKAIAIAGEPGQPVKAAAAGRVVYAGSGMKAYGKLVIVKHDAHLITAYGRNGKLLVKEGEAVKQGQTLATSAADGANKGGVLFEVREDGKAVDPQTRLPRASP
ncbi:LysM peptidoglycan-binding domain-containing M23 family metallopeptidase [Paraburkholderia sp. Ac-20347]|uniref:LysM peptidoglycan-binding domain-containing M23 family metallopeptidase n=1 Tax=Paraburkholderia sp. Ac-20347 TaxID=2703892 RepID=UPI00197D6F74|nr:LysM peptidoglycan-binding domain-containing M23 family metallopeptidase [Paraburkholderia sp. Ac-20347]MBN3813541.1 peptidoglycan DD-metalloendopeptidase family protein [Paraburkholderia sp. Ac-20347]